MQILDNKTQGRVGDKLKEEIKSGSKLSIISAYFTIYAYEHLRKELGKIDTLRLLFSEPTFINEKKDIKREFKLNGNYEKVLAGDRYEISLKGELKQSEIAKECAQWIKEKVEVKAYDEEYQLPIKGFIVENRNKEDHFTIMGSSDFNSSGLGFVSSAKPEMNTYIKDENYTKALLMQFNMFWNNESKVKDVKKYLLESLEGVYKENSPEFIYYVTIYNIFKDYLEELSEEDIVKTRTGIKDSVVWNKLYQFQKDGVLGAIDKLEKYNGCIIADSVGLGKTFEALAVIKYYELRNDRVLVLCPKKLRENWIAYRSFEKGNILVEDRLNYDVLHHTDLSRYSGKTGDIDLVKVYWENYDLIVIDESHNFRNNVARGDKETRYTRLLHKILKAGTKTKVLMLSATPVNNKMTDLKNQIYFATEGDDNALEAHGIKSIEQTLRKAQMAFNKWNDLDESSKNLESLLEHLEMDYFKLLDMLTIARSRKHIEKYYDMNAIGKFPTRLKPINKKSKIDSLDKFIPLQELNRSIRDLTLGIYSPIKYILPSKREYYSEKYDTKVKDGKSSLKQSDREQSLVHLMRINLLKRLESSIHSFGLTTVKLLNQIDNAIYKIENHSESVENIDINDIDIDDPLMDDLLIGSKKIKVLLKDMDLIKWKEELLRDKTILEYILIETSKIKADRDQKLIELKELITNKIKNPINEGNKKVIVFTAFADTAKYLYENINGYMLKEHGLYSAIITGSDTPKSSLKIRMDLNNVLTNFSPKSKERSEEGAEIDILIATDCISEGQNLQDCDYLINYDIHWNPVRIIQRFGRVDRLGSKNDVIQLVNFWPNMELDEYINLEARVSGRMVILDMSATGEENVIDTSENEMNDLDYRKKQLTQLQDQVVDLEDMSGGISITDLTFNDFKMDLVNYMKENKNIVEKAPSGMYAIAKSNTEDAKGGVIFCLKQISKEIKPSEHNPLDPYFLVYIDESGEVMLNFIQSKKILDLYKKVCSGNSELYDELIKSFNMETEDAKNMKRFAESLEKVVENIIGKEEEKGIESLFGFGETIISGTSQSMDDFELISFLIIK